LPSNECLPWLHLTGFQASFHNMKNKETEQNLTNNLKNIALCHHQIILNLDISAKYTTLSRMVLGFVHLPIQ
jgi:hypothetical protein